MCIENITPHQEKCNSYLHNDTISIILLKLLNNSNSLSVDFLFSTYTIMSYARNDHFISSLLNTPLFFLALLHFLRPPIQCCIVVIDNDYKV